MNAEHRPVAPDDERANHPVQYVLFGLLGLPMLALSIGALVLPPGIAAGLLHHGVEEGRTSYLVLGVLVAVFWFLFLFLAVRKIMGLNRLKPEERTDGGGKQRNGA